jgi:hypothetical protein
MPERSKVTSVEALDSFRAAILVFLAKARPALDEACHDVVRTRLWLQTEQRTHWERQVRRRSLELEEVRQELFSARLSKLQDATAAQYLAFRRAQRALADTEAKLNLLKTWDREIENRAAPLVKQLDNLQSFLISEMPNAAAYLSEVVKILEAYAETSLPASPAPPAPPIPEDDESNNPPSLPSSEPLSDGEKRP